MLLLWMPIDTAGTLDRPTEAISVNIVDSSVLESVKPSEKFEAAAQQASAASDPGQVVEDSQTTTRADEARPKPLEPNAPAEPLEAPQPTAEVKEERSPPPVDISAGSADAMLPDEPAPIQVPDPLPLGPRDLTARVREAVERDRPAERKDEQRPRRTADDEANPRPKLPKEDPRRDEKRQETRTAAHRGGAAARASAGASKSSAAVAASRGDLSGYAAIVRARVAANKPAGTGLRATVVVRFGVSKSGAITSAAIVTPSGNSGLDRAALAAVHRAGPFPPPPTGAPMSFSIPFTFQ